MLNGLAHWAWRLCKLCVGSEMRTSKRVWLAKRSLLMCRLALVSNARLHWDLFCIIVFVVVVQLSGRHRCVGEFFAYVQMKTIWSVLLRLFEFELVDGHFPLVNYTTMIHTPLKPVIRYRTRQGSQWIIWPLRCCLIARWVIYLSYLFPIIYTVVGAQELGLMMSMHWPTHPCVYILPIHACT